MRERAGIQAICRGLAVCCGLLLCESPTDADDAQCLGGPRQPVKIVETPTGLGIVNRRSGTISLIPWDGDMVAAEFAIAAQLNDVVRVPGRELWIAADGESNQLVVIRSTSAGLRPIAHRPVAARPETILVAADGNSCTVTSLWAHQISRYGIATHGTLCELELQAALDLPFAPRLQCLCPDQQHVVVADAFGSGLAVVELNPLRLQAVFQIPGHNIRGMAIGNDGHELMLTHQMLNDFIPTTRDHVFWGNVVSNLVRSFELDRLLGDHSETMGHPPKIFGSLFPLGQEGRAAGDPEQILLTSRGDQLIVLAGTGELAVRRPAERRFTRLAVGRRPSGIWVSSDGHEAWVANRFDDTVSVVDLNSLQVQRTIRLGPPLNLTVAQEGERLFYDASLSLHGWFSCHSCHTDGHTCGLLNDNLGDNTLGAAKRIPSLLGTADTAPWAWNGQQQHLIDQVHKSRLLTMRAAEQRTPTEAEDTAIVQFLQTLTPPPSVAAARGRQDDAAIARGQQIFAELDCTRCHTPPEYTTADVYDVGLQDGHGLTLFNPPSLRGLGQRAQYFHDNRARSLADVLAIHPEPEGLAIAPGQQDDLIAFLESL